ncbi:antirestriction protein ArdA [Kribbella voronezhensis]|uniref:Antirestriction protein ArdA n=1 Tax=Kribbella voronezhensis TaxID=2512212 RepID=A0A4R7T6U2_9ACTN|nr:antirestriction protein ArdA [Kribbella voronezhensis]TDU87584.1 antirestriction protein ArdA [Kribbella voronezhensis]
MSEQLPPPQPNGEHGVNTYGTDDPEKQAEIEAARTAAAEERRTNREKLERYVSYGLNEEDAAGLIEHEEMLAARREALAASNPEEGEADKRARPRIYVRSLVDHAEGHDIGDWIDAGQDLEDIQRDVHSILSRSLHAHWTGEPADEWAIHDQEGFGHIELSEHEPLEVVCAIGKGIHEHGLAFAAWAEIHNQLNGGIDIHTLARFSDAYLGDFENAEAYAEHIVEEMNGDAALAELPDWLREIVRLDYQRMVEQLNTAPDVHIVDHDRGVWVFDCRV